VHQWISQKSFAEQFEFGIKTIKQFGGTKYLPNHLQQEGRTMIEELVSEYQSKAKTAASVDYSDKNSVRQLNASADRMRAIVDEVVSLGTDAAIAFTCLLDQEPAASWAAHHLVEMAELDSATLSRCFSRVEQAMTDAEARGDFANAMGEDMWLNEWKAKKAHSVP